MGIFLNIAMILVGIFFLIFGAFTILSIKLKIQRSQNIGLWNILLVLVIFFVFGYTFFLLGYSQGSILPPTFINFLIAFVFFFGAIFVAGTLWLQNITLRELQENKAILNYSKTKTKEMSGVIRRLFK